MERTTAKFTERTWSGLQSRRGHGLDCDHGEDMEWTVEWTAITERT